MSSDRISAAAGASRKRKTSEDNEDLGFPPALKPIITACKPRLLLCREDSTKEYKDDRQVDLDITTTRNCDDKVEGNEGCHTPKGEEHQLPKILSCPPAPRKPRPTAKKSKSEDYFMVSRRELNFLLNLSQPKKFQVG